jgi:[acyl-carrier-protein] S-malonyltransferase
MQADMGAEYPVVEATYAEASEVVGYDLWQLVQDGPDDKLGETVVTQPAMLTAGVAAYRVWQEAGGAAPSAMAGHSLGEYTALVCAGALSFADAMKVVKRRSELMQGAVPAGVGAMAAIIGLDDDGVRSVCEEASGSGVVEPVNFNSPGQVVIAGNTEAVQKAIELADAAGARRAIMLPVSVPAHSSLMTDAGNALAEALSQAAFVTPNIVVFSASDATPYMDGEQIRQHLSKQVYSPVRWVDTVSAMVDAGATTIVECGPGRVLAGLSRRISKDTAVASVDSLAGLEKALAA